MPDHSAPVAPPPATPPAGPSNLPMWSSSPVIEWLLLEGWRVPGSTELLLQVCDRLVDAGVPLWRVFCTIPSLHPQYFGEALRWQQGEPIERMQGMWDIIDTPEYRESPIRVIVDEGAAGIRRRLICPETPLDYSILTDLKEQGATDYVILPLEFTNGERAAVSFTSNHPAGFTTAHLTQLNDLLPVLARIMENHSLRSTAVNLLDTYVGRAAGSRILSGQIRRGSAESIYSAIWYSDLRGFTSLSETLPRDSVIAALNAYLEAMTAAVHSQQGQVLKFIGDGILAMFPAEDGQSAGEACRRALAAADAAEEAMALVNEGRLAVDAPMLDYGLALHLGEVMFGNIGAADRLDFTVIGPAVNVASRLEQLCKVLRRRPLLSKAFVEGCELDQPVEPLGRYELRGLTAPHEVFAPSRKA